MSLNKLQIHQKSEVWLYIPNSFYDKADEVHELLSHKDEIKKVVRVKNVGWNVLVLTENGKQLIQEGINLSNSFIKFIYSNRNEEKNNKPNKLQKTVTYV